MMPCKDCLMIPVCRFKDYFNMIMDCSVINETLYDDTPIGPSTRLHEFDKRIVEIEKALRPISWKVELNERGLRLLGTSTITRI